MTKLFSMIYLWLMGGVLIISNSMNQYLEDTKTLTWPWKYCRKFANNFTSMRLFSVIFPWSAWFEVRSIKIFYWGVSSSMSLQDSFGRLHDKSRENTKATKQLNRLFSNKVIIQLPQVRNEGSYRLCIFLLVSLLAIHLKCFQFFLFFGRMKYYFWTGSCN